MGGGRGMGRGMGGGGNLLGLVRDVASMFSGGGSLQQRQEAPAVNEELLRQVGLLKEERGLLKERIEMLERRLELLEEDRKK